MPNCLIPGCTNDADNNVAIRCRRPDTSAIWAPNSNAYLCLAHATQGCAIDITITPNASGEVETNVSAGGAVETRTTPIR